MSTILADVRLAIRSFLKRPAFSIPIVVTLALGIGANTAVFSIVYSLVLRPFAFPEPDRVVQLNCSQLSFTTAPAAHREYVDWRDQNRVFQTVGMMQIAPMTMAGGSTPEALVGARTTASLLPVFAAPPLLGRWFSEDEDRPGGPPVAILAEGVWRRQFGADPAVIGRVVTIDGVGRTVVGVMPDAPFDGFVRLDVFTPAAVALDRQNGLHDYWVFARLKPGVTVGQAKSEMVALGRRLAVENRTNHGINVRGYRESLPGAVAASAVLMLFAVVTVVLLIACANVANLLLARGTSRRREVAVRIAMGASRLQLARQLLVESSVLALAGGIAGFLVAWGCLRALLAAVADALPPIVMRILPTVRMDWHVMLFTMAVALTTGLLFGLAPLVGQASSRAADALKDESGRATGSVAARRLGGALVIAEVALSVLLLTGATLLVKSLVRLGAQQTGLVADGVLAFDVSLPQRTYASPDSIRAVQREAIARLRRLPGVTSAGMIAGLPMHDAGANGYIDIDGKAPWTKQSPLTNMAWVAGSYFETMKIPLLRGRYLNEQDDERAPMVAVVNQSLAARCWPGQDPIGKRVRAWGTWRQVVGVVGDVRSENPATPAAWKVDVPAAQEAGDNKFFSFTLRTSSGDPAALAGAVRREMAAIDSTLAPTKVQRMEEVVSRAAGPWRLVSGMTSAFAALAALLAVVGMYGLIAYTVGQRTREFGIRMALGANRAAVARLVLVRGMKLAGVGVALGALAGAAVARAISGLLYQVAPGDPWVLGGTSVAALAATLAACYLPARAASRVDPIVTLRAL